MAGSTWRFAIELLVIRTVQAESSLLLPGKCTPPLLNGSGFYPNNIANIRINQGDKYFSERIVMPIEYGVSRLTQ